MVKINRLIALLVMVCMVCSLLPVYNSNAANDTFQIKVDGYSNDTLTLHWDIISSVKSARVTYHDPKSINTDFVEQIDVTSNKVVLNKIKSDYIYDIKVDLYDTTTPAGLSISSGFVNYLPSISFISDFVEEPLNDDITKGPITPSYDPKGGREIGKSPKLHLSWQVPKVYDPVTKTFIRSDSPAGLKAISDGLQSVYGGSQTITKLDYRINISQNSKDMSMIDAVIIDGSDPSSIKASVSGDPLKQATVARSSTGMQDLLSMDLQGRSSELDIVTDPFGSTLGHKGILPGSVYYMNIQANFEGIRDVVYLDKGSSVLKNNPYTYTPMRFQLSKDYANNVYAKVYTINQGSLLLPELYYEIQTNTLNSNLGWETKAKMDPDYFKDTGGKNYEFGIIPILNVSSNNNIYYRVIVTSNGQDVLKSQSLTYQISKDTSTPAIPSGLGTSTRMPVTGPNPNANATEKPIIQSTDVTVFWDKPLNWDEIKKDSKDTNGTINDTYFCFVLNVNQSDITEQPFPELLDQDGQSQEGTISYGSFPAKYRLVRYVNAASINIDDTSSSLKYNLKGLEMFKEEGADGSLTSFDDAFMAKMGIEASYPKHLLSNRVYYLQMYAVKGLPTDVNADKYSSQRSVTTSFTTLSSSKKVVPLPNNFMLSPKNGNVFDKIKKTNVINLQFDTINNLKWEDYDSSPNTTSNNLLVYELFMNTDSGPTGWIKIGSVSTKDNKNATAKGNNVQFQFITSAQKTYLTASIESFIDNGDVLDETDDALSSFGSRLSPNTSYFFKIRAKLVMPGSAPNEALQEQASPDSYILPVTTVRSGINPPDPQDRTPLAPTDFSIAKDSNGNLILKSKNVAFNWLRQENDVKYTLICTSKRVTMNADPTTYLNDPVYQDFRRNFDITNTEQIGITLDPASTTQQIFPATSSVALNYDRATKTLNFAVNKWLFPNRLYYFTIRAERVNKYGILKTSAWISIPVTTQLIQAPTSLEPMIDAQLGFYWLDNSMSAKPEDFIIYIKGPGDQNYKPLGRSQSTVTREVDVVYKDNNMYYKYYGRIYNLKKNASYSIAVYKGANTTTPVYQKTGMNTRNGFRQIEVSWHGINDYKYEIAIKTADASTYTTLTNEDLELYSDSDGKLLPYYKEENSITVDSEEVIYNARIKSLRVALPNGIVERRQLKPNSKYDIRVRAVSVDSLDTTIAAYSKYAGPVQTRTEFDQGDYDKEETDKDREAKFLDRIKQVEKGYFWKLDVSNSYINKIMLKGDRVASAIENSGSLPFAIDLTEFSINMDTDVICIPINIINMLNNKVKSMKIISNESEYTFKPNMIVPENQKELKVIAAKTGVKDTMLELMLKRSIENTNSPVKTGQPSKFHDVRLQAFGLSIDYPTLQKQISDKLYNSADGLVAKNLKTLSSSSSLLNVNDNKVMDEYINLLIKQIEINLSSYINTTITGSKVFGAQAEVTTFEKPMLIKIKAPDDGLRTPYAYYSGGAKWKKLLTLNDDAASITFNSLGTGKFVIMTTGAAINDVPDDYWAAASIRKLAGKIDLSKIFGDIEKGFEPDNSLNGNELVLLYENLAGRASQNTGMDIRQKAKAMGLDKYLIMSQIMGGVQKQQAAAIFIMLYTNKQGISQDQLTSSSQSNINDQSIIQGKYIQQVGLSIDLRLMSLDEDGNFGPDALITRAQAITTLVKLLELTGDISEGTK